MSAQCVSIRSKTAPGERCGNRAITGSEWCGKHKTSCVRYSPPVVNDVIQHTDTITRCPDTVTLERRGLDIGAAHAEAGKRVLRVWRRWLSRRAGPLLWFREESNNPADFFSGDPVTELRIGDVISFVDAGKGYIMDIKSAVSLLEHAAANKEQPLNPFNRAPLPPTFLRRLGRHGVKVGWASMQAVTEEQRLSLACTDIFRAIEDLGYYTDPNWFMELDRIHLQRYYMELADIWFHRAGLSIEDRNRICPPPTHAFPMSVQGSLAASHKAMRHLLLRTLRVLVTAAPNRADRQTGVMYVLGALSLVSQGCRVAYPWMFEMFAPGVARIVGSQIIVLHPAVLGY
jgi:hypothetical protein